MRSLSLFFCIFCLTSINGQTKDVAKAFSYYTTYIKEKKESDLDKAYELITNSLKDPANSSNEEALFYQAVIVKQYFETKRPDNRADLIALTAQSLIKSYKIKKDYKNKDKLYRLMQIAGYDLYAEGIRQHKENKHEIAYQLYKELFVLQSILEENKLNFSIESNTGEKSDLSSQDITNNMVVFCINSGKKEEAKELFEKEVKRNPSPLTYARLIQLSYQLEDKVTANKYIQEGVSKYPLDGDLLIFSINSSLDEKDYNKAIRQLNEAIKVAPSTSLYLVKSQALESQDKYDEAIANYREGLKLYPNDFDMNYGLGYALLNSAFGILNEQNDATKPNGIARSKEAKEYFNKAKAINPTKVEFDKIFEQINRIK